MARILVIDDNETLREGAVVVCERMQHEVLAAGSGAEGLQIFRTSSVDLVLTDLKMEGVSGIDVLRTVKEIEPDAAVVIMTAYGSIENAVEAMRLGASDYIEKPFSPGALRIKLERALDRQRLLRDNARLSATAKVLSGLSDDEPGTRDEDAEGPETNRGEAELKRLVGVSQAMVDLKGRIRKVASSETHVHISGASGTGKELVASAIHALSRRRAGPFIKINCGAIPETLIESELFGHEKGAFTGAIKRKFGRFELADGGTILLDEVAELSLAMQVKLLRVLQEQELDRVGGERPVKVDVRVISATNKNLQEEVESGRFREDLFYRLHVVPLRIPSLRERTDDIVPLANHFVEKLRRKSNPKVAAISKEAAAQLVAYHYPGNVRELENIIEQALVFATPPEIEPGDLPAQVAGARPRNNVFQLPFGQSDLNEFLENAERQLILAAYEACGGVKTETAKYLGIKTPALYYKLEKYGIGEVAKRGSEASEPADAAAPSGPEAASGSGSALGLGSDSSDKTGSRST